MKLHHILHENDERHDQEPDPFALEDYSDEEYGRNINVDYTPSGNIALSNITARELLKQYYDLKQSEHAWNSIRAAIENQIENNHRLDDALEQHPDLMQKYSPNFDNTDVLEVGVTSISMNLVPDDLKPWVQKLAKRAQHASDMSLAAGEQAAVIGKKLKSHVRKTKNLAKM